MYQIEKYNGYDTGILDDRFRALSILKNRDGESDKKIGLKFLGEIGYFEELPRSSELTEEEYLKIKNLK